MEHSRMDLMDHLFKLLLLIVLLISSKPALTQETIFADGFETPVDKSITIYNRAGVTQTNRPISIARVFRQGDIAEFAQARINSQILLTQVDVKNRWPDGSLKFAIVSFIVPTLPANGLVKIHFDSQPTGNNEDYLSVSDMLSTAYNFDADIHMQGANAASVSAREMLEANHIRYWLKGPIVTEVIIEDRSPQRSFDQDFGDGSKALHPIFEARFYPSNQSVELGYTMENTWASRDQSRSMRDLNYSLTLTSGNSNPVTEYTHGTFNHIGKSRWYRRAWLGNDDPQPIHIDHNIEYLVQTKAIPNYDTALNIDEDLVAGHYNSWQSADQSLDGDDKAVGNYKKSMNAGGQADWIGLMNTWDTLYLLTMDKRLREKSLGNADLAGRIPMHYREADTMAGTGDYFDRAGTVDTFGRVISVNARRQQTLSYLNPNCPDPLGDDEIRLGTVSNDDWGTIQRDHMVEVSYIPYLMSGRYYYLEELQYWAAYVIAHKRGCYAQSYNRHGEAGYLQDSQVRGDAWGLRTLAYAAFIAVDASPEKAYFEDIIANNIAKWEGERDLPNSNPAKLSHWQYGNTVTRDSRGPSPLGLWRSKSGDIADPVIKDGSVATAVSPWMDNFLLAALGMTHQLGYDTSELLKFMAINRFNLLLNPQVSPYLVESYRHPSTLTATDDWIQNWSDFEQHFATIPSGWALNRSVDHGYGYIALGALSFLYPYQAGDYSGQQAWDWFKANKPQQDRFGTVSPKWAILPINFSAVD